MKPFILLLLLAAFAAGQTCQTTDIEQNATADGTLSETDCTVRDYVRSDTSNLKADAWRLTLRERAVVSIRMASTEIDPFLYLLTEQGAVLARNDNSGGGKNAEIATQLQAGAYVVVTAAGVTGVGAYQVTTSTRAPKTCTAQDLPLTGEAVEADLTERDCAGVDLALLAVDTTPVDVYRIAVGRTSILNAVMTSAAVDAFLGLYDSNGRRVATDNDSGGGTNSRLRISLPEGTYTLRAGVNRPGTGVYRISASLEDRRVCEPVTLNPGERLDAEFTGTDCRLFDVLTFQTWDGPLDQYRIEIKERAVVKIRQQSPLLDSYLMILDANRRVLTQNDDAASTTTDSEIYMSLNAGTYTVLAMEYYGDIGKYSIVLDTENLRPCPETSFNAPGSAAGSLTAEGCRVMDLYSPSSSTVPATKFKMTVAERAWTTVSGAGTGLNPLVELVLEDGTPIGIDGPVKEKSVLLLPGTYTVEVSTRERGTGELSLTAITRPPAVCDASTLVAGTTTTGELTTGDCLQRELLPFFNGASRVDLWKFDVESPGPMLAEVNTEAGAPFLFLLDADLRVVTASINGTLSPAARLSWQGRSGAFYLMVGAYSGPGPYTVRVSRDSAGVVQ